MKNLSLEKINKSLFLLSFVLLIFKRGSFAISHMPNPFEIVFTLVVFLTIIDLILNKKIKEFWLSIPKKIWIAVFVMILSILAGWVFAVLVRNLPITFNNILEFGGFFIGLTAFVLVLFYTRKDESFRRKCLFALLTLSVYVLALLPAVTDSLHLASGTIFLGLSINPNVMAKILLVPAMAFMTFTIFELENKSLKLVYFLIAAILVSLVFWTGSRGALVSMSLGSLLLFFVFIFRDFRWRKTFITAALILGVILAGYLITPNQSRLAFLARNFSPVNIELTKEIIRGQKDPKVYRGEYLAVPESRLTLWPTYLKAISKNPIGVGPNTHFGVTTSKGRYWEIGPHNTYIELLLWGGLALLLSYFYILFGALKNLKKRLKLNFNKIDLALLVILFTLSIAVFFNDCLQFYWLFIILALASKK